jgi:hypothetical protein
MDGKPCWFKRTQADKEWELGDALNFYNTAVTGGGNETKVIVSAKEDGMTLSIPTNLVYFTDENPDKIRERLDRKEAERIEKERLDRHAENERRVAAARIETARAEQHHAELQKQAQQGSQQSQAPHQEAPPAQPAQPAAQPAK